MTIKILGPGCMNCKTLERRAHEAVQQLNIDALIEKVTDIEGITSYGVVRTPGLVIDEKLLMQGRIPTVEQIKELINAEQRHAITQ